jgi:hypothetical protein
VSVELCLLCTKCRPTHGGRTTRQRHMGGDHDSGAPRARIDHTAVWTGTKMIVWGGCRFVNDACSARPSATAAADTTPPRTAGSPRARRRSRARQDHTAVWSGNEMIVWGGAGAAVYGNGARYDPLRTHGRRRP